ncbi:conserved hypothetical protein [Leishmania infantum JPCM5]|uniref:Kelch_motif/Galactose_oxidase_-_central_domain_containing_protein_-_putative n=2 Tax=Leishmania infantum TaxID=5671 RepID=A0A6L0XT14_LEIIN|nr:conserved hypothetical protein [Leishmania infantum JPCM5]CAC9549632.1 Kelch_motif/Galactose_oxidase_-_central_domain_containing_protein_-_putative [Leishmania infantum]CAM72847.1 conserved hypothetical protein [Leishmania infantum JPCM5]SUZ46525.1 Kelch_motif/Galactose_oxidase_-_central_domain_containing_protein_-_putative [Leishmania infantum]|eukprot:XP_001469735.1 conserved hypothetical protein [Leishmania infantum JPCM5]
MSTSLRPSAPLAALPSSNLAASTPHPRNGNATASPALTMLPTLSLDNALKRTTDDQGRQRDGAGAPDNNTSSAHRRSLIGVRGSVLPEKKGGLPKTGHIGVCYHQNVYVFGGVNSKGQFSNHVFCYEKRTLQWREIRGVGVVPRGRANHAAVLIGNKIYIHGGHRHLEVFDDFFAYEIETGRWEKIGCERSQGPGPIFLHSMVYIPPLDSLLVLGGIHQREQNNCLGHLFDVRNRVWTGVPPPSSVDAQHLQMVTAAYHVPSAVVVVLGLMDADVMQEGAVTTPHVHVFQPATFVWRRVDTSTAPMSPLPFRMEAMWESLLHFLIPGGGGVYDPLLENWMFPLPSTETDSVGDDGAVDQSPSTPGFGLPPLPLNKYGFLVLDLRSMSWSLVPCNLSRKLVAELNAVNRVTREKMERLVLRNNAAAAAIALSGNSSQSKSAVQQPADSGALLGISSASLTHGPSGVASRHSSVFRHQSSQWPRNESSSTNVPWPRATGSRAAMASGSNDGKMAALLSSSRYRRLFFFDDAPEFMRKYTLVVVRDEPTKSGKLRPLQYVVLHGGLTEPMDYAMLMFAPILTRPHSNAATPTGRAGLMARSNSLRGRAAASVGSRRGSAYTQSRSEEDGGYEDDSFDDVTSLLSSGTLIAAYSTQSNHRRTAPHTPLRDAEALAHLRGGRYSDDDEYDTNVHERMDNGGAAHKSFLLPTLQSGRTRRNYYRFALQFTPGNSIQKESLLPYANIPVAVLQTPKDVQKWSRNYYTDQRRWLSERIKEAMIEDRKLRRLRQLNKAQVATASGAQGNAAWAGSAGRDDSSNSESEFMDGLYLAETFIGDPRTHGGAKVSSLLAYEDQLALDAADAALTQAGAPKRRLRDFFEQHGLDAFEEADIQQQHERMQLRTALGGRGAKHDRRRKDARLKERAVVAEGANAKAAKRSETSPLVKKSSVSDGSMPLASEVQMTDSGFERLRMKGWQDVGRERMAAAVLHGSFINGLAGGTTGSELDFRKLAAYALLRRAIARLRADGNPYEMRRRRAQLRWRYLRTLVCTGEAAYLLYLASQAEFKMRGIMVTGTQGLMLAPELHFLSPLQAYRVPCKPVPYNVAAASAPAPASSSRFAQVTASGMVVYHSLK